MVTSKKLNLKICLFFPLTVKCMVMVLMNVLGCILIFVKLKLCPYNLNKMMDLLSRMFVFLLLRLKDIILSLVMLLYLCLLTLPPFKPNPFIPIRIVPLWMLLLVCRLMLLVHWPIVLMILTTQTTKSQLTLSLSLSLNIANFELLVMDCLLNTKKSSNIDVSLCYVHGQEDVFRNESNNIGA
ncbi:hypothetical protein MA16_Dca027532 [Dendrobium catenatum]|uniref:Uncharacterized protein n=1 Tax=Dendrobium catenatum TaxID=906689 RepID=A0A2I0V894_9ASPA|nr:hypothetical protein MA16_Dca027532 [Dendrobium catenatum]